MRWWQRLLKGNRLEQELDAELRYHLERQVEDNIRSGMPEHEARRRAHVQMGGLEQVKESCRDARGTRWAGDIAQDLRFATRLLAKDRGFTFAAVATLALAVGLNTAMFSIIQSVLLTPLPYSEPERMLWISENDLRGPNRLAMVFAQDVEEWRTRSRSLEALSVLFTGDATLGRDEPMQIRVASVSESLARIFGVAPAVGRDFIPRDFNSAPQPPGLRAAPENRSDTGVAILSARLLRRLGRDSAILGETVTINNIEYTVVGVLPPSFRLPVAPSLQLGIGPQTEVDLVVNAAVSRTYRGPGALIGRLSPGSDAGSTFTELEAIRKAANKARAENESSSHLSLQVTLLHDYIVSGTRPILLASWASVGFVLLVACVNIVNLLLARGVAREQETALRAALGAGRWRLVRQVLTENMMLVLAGGTLGVLLAYALVNAISRTSAIDVPRLQDATLSWPVLLFSIGVCAGCTVLLSILPAAHSYHGVATWLKTSAGTTAGTGARRWHGALVVCELALVMVPLTGAGLMLRSLSNVWAESAASMPRQVLMTRVQASGSSNATSPAERLQRTDRILGEVEALPGVQAAAFWGVTFGYPSRISGLPEPANDAVAMWFNVSPRFQEASGLRLLAGRWFTEADRNATPPVVVVSDRFVRTFSSRLRDAQSIVGRTTVGPFAAPGSKDREGPMTIVGVVSDFRSGRLGILRPDDENALPQVFFPDALRPTVGGELLVRTASAPLSSIDSVRDVVQRAGLRLMSVQTLDGQLSESLAARSFNTVLLTSFAAIAAVLAIVGVSGVLRYSVVQRTREIGLRLALGAQRRDVVQMIVARVLLLMVAGIGTGLVGSAIVARLLSSVLYGVRPVDTQTYIWATALILVAALIAAYLPVHRAVRLDPMKALRHD